MKTCTRCGEVKPLDAFSRWVRGKDGRRLECRACSAERKRAWDDANRERIAAYCRKYREANRERIAAAREHRLSMQALWREANRDRLRAMQAGYRRENAAAVNADCALRRAARLRATPPWLTREQRDEMAAAYHLAREFGAHVDHIVPLKGANVCGLHVPWNLRVIPAAENLSKGNRLLEAA